MCEETMQQMMWNKERIRDSEARLDRL
jgi:hypothetical protein